VMEMFLFSEEEDFLEGCMWTFGGVIPTVRLLYDINFRVCGQIPTRSREHGNSEYRRTRRVTFTYSPSYFKGKIA
jgi:hypothetical protein